MKKDLKKNAEKEKEREESIPRGEPQRKKIQKPIVVEPSSLEVVPRAPFPHRLKEIRKKDHFEGILKVFKNVQINIPLLDAIKQIPSYSKFLKDLTVVKRKTSVPRTAVMAAQASGLI